MVIVRLIADPAVVSANLDKVRARARETGLTFLDAAPLESDNHVWQLRFDEPDAALVRPMIDACFQPSDVLIANHEPSVPRVFVSDMDSTMISAECIDELADFAGIKAKVAAITERAMQGELDFAEALAHRVGLLKDLPESSIACCLAERIRPMEGAKTLVRTLHAHGARTILVTGGFHQFADPVAEDLGFDDVVGNCLAVQDGVLTGGLAGPITDSATKLATLEQAVAESGKGAISLAIGDGANDTPMIRAATYGIAFRAKPKTREAAHGWIDYGDLTNVLRLLGIPQVRWIQAE